MKTTFVPYTLNQTHYHGYLASPTDTTRQHPLVILAHDWSGQNEFIKKKAEYIAGLGYHGFALDMYGEGKLGQTNDEKLALMSPLVNDRQYLQQVVGAAFTAAINLPSVDHDRIAAIGFCFGGLCALDLARSNREIRAVASFHGLLNKPNINNYQLAAKVIAFHGFLDPMVTMNDLTAFYEEMNAAKIDWQVHIYGTALHAFTNPQANDYQFGTVYDPTIEKRSFSSCEKFFAEAFGVI